MQISNIIQTSDGYSVTIDGTDLLVPLDPGNRHYQAIQEAIAAGNPVGQETLPDPRLSMTLTRRQVIAGMLIDGIITDAEALALAQNGTIPVTIQNVIDTLPTERERSLAVITFVQFSGAFRLDPMTLLLQAAGGLTDTEMDTFFTTYAAL